MAVRDNIVGRSEDTFIGEGLSYYGHTFAIPNGAKALMCEGNYGVFFIDISSMRATSGSTNIAFSANVTSARFGGYKVLYNPSAKTVDINGVDSNYYPFLKNVVYTFIWL